MVDWSNFLDTQYSEGYISGIKIYKINMVSPNFVEINIDKNGIFLYLNHFYLIIRICSEI